MCVPSTSSDERRAAGVDVAPQLLRRRCAWSDRARTVRRHPGLGGTEKIRHVGVSQFRLLNKYPEQSPVAALLIIRACCRARRRRAAIPTSSANLKGLLQVSCNRPVRGALHHPVARDARRYPTHVQLLFAFTVDGFATGLHRDRCARRRGSHRPALRWATKAVRPDARRVRRSSSPDAGEEYLALPCDIPGHRFPASCG